MTARGRAPRVLFRCDARPDLGGGHVMRCLALADALERKGARIGFSVNEGATRVAPALRRAGHAIAVAPETRLAPAPWDGPSDLIVVDCYDIDAGIEQDFRRMTRRIAVIDDLADRAHDCDLLLDQNYGKDAARYAGLVPDHAALLLGPDYALLRPEFAARRDESLARRRRPSLERVLVSLGLTDVGGVTARIVDALLGADPEIAVDAVIAAGAASRETLEERSRAEPRLSLHLDAADMAELMTRADLAVGAGGGTALERCALGLPSLVTVLADNQADLAASLDAAGAAIGVGRDDGDLGERIAKCLVDLRETPTMLRVMSDAAARICDGRGAERVAGRMLGLFEPAGADG
ncbi:UDP-2,4-diacetamido-2,4,6-trideoxy-beta-L-altropyranose hydrolase [Marinicauda salina]|uniref:UDP-2,4-diacetamido-2,4, 6-trideoxy-beta-L-altropyranose hydrolase n=1 Tax=Marinicauda salina TaxID=2135793 RepID=UPI001304FB3B|nr:UDP-2,4-diacetamido-2,4,6-trideoxy-beta-L-altropyranose hydrolase [Marinicauda salina]